jgi:Mn2+/Fe2+ NRAMP family transporter
LMGGFTNGVIISALGWLTVGLILALNAVLLGLSVSP